MYLAKFRTLMRPRDPQQMMMTGIAVACVAILVLTGCWYFLWREVTFTVNGEEITATASTSLSEILDEYDQFGVTPGRLLSVTGEVISEDGGTPCTVTRGSDELTTDEVSRARVHDDDEFTVTDGVDVEEDSTEEVVEIEPTVEIEEGGAVQYVSQWGKAGKKRVKKGETSGETVDIEVLEESQNMVVSSTNLSPSGGKYVALTFDDGPSSYTSEILDILEEKDVKATFFNLGSEVQKYPDECQAIVDAGHELASHTMEHENLPDADTETLRSEITEAADAIEDATGLTVQMIRAPYGAFTSAEWARAGDLISCNVLWNIDTLDWERPGADSITSAVLDSAFNGAIILMHDGGGNREEDVEALPDIIDGLREDGYEFVTVSELMELDGSIPEDVINGTVNMPDDADTPSTD